MGKKTTVPENVLKESETTLNKKIQYLTDARAKMDKFGLKKHSHFRVNFPEFAEIMKNDQDVRALLRLSLSWSKFQLLQLTSYGHKNNRTKTFWARSKTHLAMFHTLMRTFGDQILFAEERGDSNWDSVGVGLIELEANMRMAENTSGRKVRRIIQEGLAEGHCFQSYWKHDKRHKVIYISPRSVMDYMCNAIPRYMEDAVDVGLKSTHVDLLDRLDAKPSMMSSIKNKFLKTLQGG